MRLNYKQTAEVLGRPWRALRTLLGQGTAGPHRIEATYRPGTRAAAFSIDDVLRLAVVERFNDRNVLSPAGRREIYDAVPREIAAEILAGRGPRFFATDGKNYLFADSADLVAIALGCSILLDLHDVADSIRARIEALVARGEVKQ